MRAYDYSFPVTQSVGLPVGNMQSPTRSPAMPWGRVHAHVHVDRVLFDRTTVSSMACLGCKLFVFG